MKIIKEYLAKHWPLVWRKDAEQMQRAYEGALAQAHDEVRSVRKNAEGLVAEYNELEKHKDKFVQQNFALRAALTRSEEQVAELTIELSKATKNDHRDAAGRFTPAGHPPAPGTPESVAQGFEPAPVVPYGAPRREIDEV